MATKTKELTQTENIKTTDEMVIWDGVHTLRTPSVALAQVLNAGNLKMPDSDETIAEHYRQFCNRNLLDNWYFANPVNQKGQMEYTGSGYTIDRWRSYGAKVSINDGYISLSTEGNPTFCQKSELDLYDKTLTFSVLLANGSLCTGTGILASDTAWKNTTLYEDSSIKLWLQNSNPLFNTAIDIKGNTPVDLVAAKLEFGSSQTLAHKEGSKWVLNEIPDYATELAKCQRYFYKTQGAFEYRGIAISRWYVSSGTIELPVPMRIKPACKIFDRSGNVGKISTRNTGETVNGSIAAATNRVVYAYATDANFVTGTEYDFAIEANANL